METHLNQKNIQTYQSIQHKNFNSVLLKNIQTYQLTHMRAYIVCKWPMQELVWVIYKQYLKLNLELVLSIILSRIEVKILPKLVFETWINYLDCPM